MTLVAVGHRELLAPNAPSQEVEYLKADYGLVDSKFTCYHGGSSKLNQCLNQMSPFLDEVDLHGFVATLGSRVAEIEALIEEENKGFHEVELALEASSLQALIARMEFEEEKTTHLNKLKTF